MTTSEPDTCAECGRPLLLSNGSLMCCWRDCPVYGQDIGQDDDGTADRFQAWLADNPAVAGLDAWRRFLDHDRQVTA